MAGARRWPCPGRGVAHQQQRGDRFERVEQAEHAALAIADAKGKRFDQRALQREPERRGVHFVFRQFELAVADIFIGEEFYFLEADHLRAHQHVAVGRTARMRGGPAISMRFALRRFPARGPACSGWRRCSNPRRRASRRLCAPRN